MFHIFSKKKFLVDYLQNFVDIHNHILPGIDDGAKNVQESIELILGFRELGITNLVATPHIMNNFYPNTRETINSSLDELTNELLANDIKEFSIEASAEHMIDDNFEELLARSEVMPMRKQYLLVEMSYLQPSINFDDAIIKTSGKQLFSILAHPERYNFLHGQMKKYTQYKKKGIQFQLNLLSLGEYYGGEIPKIACKLLNEGLIDYVASDIHTIYQLNSLRKITLNNRMVKQLMPIINNTIRTFY
jgi:tyrosine-protein phosphatase YwqE